MMSLLLVIPTYNRSVLLRKTLASVLRARRPAGLQLSVLVVDNNSPDDTRAVVEEMAAGASIPVGYLLETRQSSSYARNAGVLACTTDLIGFVDDDEEVEEHWFEVAAREFADPETDFIGGSCFAGSEFTPPAWLPPDYPAVIGVSQPRPRVVYGPATGGNLNSGNCVLRRSVFDRAGLYSTELGRSAKGLLSEEDAELYERIRALGLRGVFVPDLIIFHYIPPARLTRHYHRRWCFWRGVSQGLLARRQRQEAVPYIFGVPRYRLGRAARSAAELPLLRPGRTPAQRFNSELALWDLFGFVYGRFLVRPSRLY